MVAVMLPAQPSQPTIKLIYTFRTLGIPTAIVEVSPGKFLGLIVTPPGIFSITSDGSYVNLYTFIFSELFSVAPNGKLTTHAYNGSTQGGPNIPVQHPDNYLYSIFGIAGGSQTF